MYGRIKMLNHISNKTGEQVMLDDLFILDKL